MKAHIGILLAATCALPVAATAQEKPFVEARGSTADRTWSHDPKTRNLEVQVKVAAGEDSIVNIEWQ